MSGTKLGTLGPLGPPHSAGPSRAEMQLEQVQKAGWPRLEVEELAFGRHFICHEPSGDLFVAHRGELTDTLYSTCAAYFVRDNGELGFLQKPPSGLPQTRAELMQRKEQRPAGRVRHR